MEEETSLDKKITTTFRHDVVRELLKSKLANPKNKISDATVDVITELARIMVIEASARACHQAQMEEKTLVSLDHVEAILAQMMLDFP